MEKFMQEAIKEAKKGMKNNEGGPFGAIIVKDNKIIGRGHNQVILLNDPTAHAEIQAIRDACKNINNFSLKGSILYTNCEPCPMCFSAIHWARIDKVIYCTSKDEAKKIGFDDSLIYDIIRGKIKDNIDFKQIDIKECINICEEWDKKEDKIEY